MKTLRIASTLLLIATASSSFASVNTDLKRCAADALEKADFQSKSLTVETPSNDIEIMDHSASRTIREYRMELVSPSSELKIGTVACRINNSGEIISLDFLSQADKI